MKINTPFFKLLCVLQSLFLLVPVASALPHGEVVTSGSVSFSRSGNKLTVNQASGAAIVQYGHFGIAAGENVTFNQPGSGSSILNRVVGGGPSTIAGSLNANGNVFLINPSGILFAPGSSVNVHGLVASGMQMSDADFLSGNMRFSGGGGSVVNQGSINAAFAYLVGGVVRNDGGISAGSVALAAGQQSVVIGNAGGGQIQLIIDGQEVGPKGQAVAGLSETGSVTDASASSDPAEATTGEDGEALAATTEGLQTGDVVNAGTINATQAIGGEIALGGEAIAQYGTVTADGLDGAGGHIGISASEAIVLSYNSITTANAGLNGTGGEIRIFADDRTAVSSGATLEARGGSASGDGGFVEVSGVRYVELNTVVDVRSPTGKDGTLLIDPSDYLIETDTSTTPFSTDGFFNPTPPPRFWTPTAPSSIIHLQDLNNQLLFGDVMLNTASPDGSAGNIVIQDSVPGAQSGPNAPPGGLEPLALNNTLGNTLFLDANGNIQILTPITPGAPGESFNLIANAGGDINIQQPISTGGGHLDFDADGNLLINGGIDARDMAGANGGDILLGAQGDVEFGFGTFDIQTAGNGAIVVSADSDFNQSGDILSFFDSGNQQVLTQNGNIFFSANTIQIPSTMQVNASGTGSVSIFAETDLDNAGNLQGENVLLQSTGSVNHDGFIFAHNVVGVEATGPFFGHGSIEGDRVGFEVDHFGGGGQGEAVFITAFTNLKLLEVNPGLSTTFPSIDSMSNPVEADIIGPDLSLGAPTTDFGFRIAKTEVLCPVIPPPVIPPDETPIFFPEPREPEPAPPPPPPFPEIDIRRRLLRPARAAQLDEVEGGKEKLAQFNEFYFLTTAMVVSEYGRGLDLNSIDHLAFGTANIGGPGLADFPANAKKAIYFGKIKSFDAIDTGTIRIRAE